MKTVGISGPLLSLRDPVRLLLAAAFLGVMLFGGQRVSPRMHALAAFWSRSAPQISAFWISRSTSWMQKPAGFA